MGKGVNRMKVEVHFLEQPNIDWSCETYNNAEENWGNAALHSFQRNLYERRTGSYFLVWLRWGRCKGNLCATSLYKIKKSDWERLPAYRREVLYQFKPWSWNLQGYGFIYYGKQRTEAAGIKPILLSWQILSEELSGVWRMGMQHAEHLWTAAERETSSAMRGSFKKVITWWRKNMRSIF